MCGVIGSVMSLEKPGQSVSENVWKDVGTNHLKVIQDKSFFYLILHISLRSLILCVCF